MAASTAPSVVGGILDKKAGSKNSGKSAEPKRPVQPPIKCPECGSSRIWKDGLRYTNHGIVQRYICRNCAYRFSDPNFQRSLNALEIPQHVQNVVTKKIKTHADILSHRQVCAALTRGTKNLTTVEARKEKWTAGATGQAADIKGKILAYAWHLKKEGRKSGTIRTYTRCLNALVQQGANLVNPDSVKETLALTEKWSDASKATMTTVYNGFLNFLGLKWTKPKYKQQIKLPFIPTEQEIDSLIAASGKKLATLLQLLKETGCRVGEATRITWTDLNEDAQTITVNSPEKNSLPGIFKVSPKLMAMLNALPRKSEKIFHKANPNSMYLCLSRVRRKLTIKLQNPRIEQITFHTLRHWKATMEYHKTKDIVHVKNLLRHRKIENTMIYVNLEAALFQNQNDEFHVKTAETTEDLKALLEVGFEYVCEKDGMVLLRKRK